MPGCNASCKCPTFKEHARSVAVASAAMPTRSRDYAATEKQWEREGEAYKRLYRQGYELPKLAGADKIESQATTELELKQGRLHGPNAKKIEKAAAELGVA